ncbi:hypothetical protein L210DRAFT_2192135 [Boletus edulis BED1]|uniref:Uncharacterized protein n=1 Tax=Boletus edulis BED1 TaxID=1328754 RepID=A0AAD4BU04_BOLED|nr:hypothetical protein L210DRAFT_2192135 [Boletus edulis BED1]
MYSGSTGRSAISLLGGILVLLIDLSRKITVASLHFLAPSTKTSEGVAHPANLAGPACSPKSSFSAIIVCARIMSLFDIGQFRVSFAGKRKTTILFASSAPEKAMSADTS